MLSNFGLSSKSNPRNYEKSVEDVKDVYSDGNGA
jgi:hypothetical protein